MKKFIQGIKSEKGFTLLEVILTLVFIAIFGSMLASFMGAGISKSADPVNQVRNLASASGCLENISANYYAYLIIDGKTSADWSSFKTGISAACSTSGITPAKTTVASGSGIYSGNFETIRVSATKGDQTFSTYFSE
jgi:prepilin-type N-terminal cleavage/methylation domain-containing protein